MHDDEALRQAIAMGKKVALPSTARSLTAPEVAATDRRGGLVVLGFYYAMAAFIVAAVLFDGGGTANDGLIWWVLPLALLGGLPVMLLLRRRRLHRKDYRDPQTVVEAREDRITMRQPALVHDIDYRDVRFELIFLRQRRGTVYLGMVMPSPLGPLHLDERSFRNGTKTGAAIIARCADLGTLGSSTA